MNIIELLKTSLGRFRILAFIEGVSFLIILGITMPLKYIYQMPEPNKLAGIIHGVLFVLYVLGVIRLRIEQAWSNTKTFWALLASIIPFGTFWADAKLFQEPKKAI